MPEQFDLDARIIWDKTGTAAFLDWFEERIRKVAATTAGQTGNVAPGQFFSNKEGRAAAESAGDDFAAQRVAALERFILALRRGADAEEANLIRSEQANVAYAERVASVRQSAANEAALAADGGFLAELQAATKVVAEQRLAVDKEALDAARLRAGTFVAAANVTTREEGLVPGVGPLPTSNPTGRFQTEAFYAAQRAAAVDLNKISVPYADINAINRNLAEQDAAAAAAAVEQRKAFAAEWEAVQLEAITAKKVADQKLADAVVYEAELRVERATAREAEIDALQLAYLGEIEQQVAVEAQLRNERAAFIEKQAAFEALWIQVQEEELAAETAAHERALATYNAAATNRQIIAARALATEQVAAESQAAPTAFQVFRGRLSGEDPLDQKTLGGSFGGAGLGKTAGFLIGGLVLFDLLAQVRATITEAGKLQKEFSLIQTILESVGESKSFEGIKTQILDLSTATATSADVVAGVERVLAGVFSSDKGVPDFGRAAVEAKTVLETAKVTGEAVTKVEDQLTAISLSFAKNSVAPEFKGIVDYALALDQATGTSSAEILGFTATLAPLGQELGFTVKQLEGLGAVMSQVSGRPATALAENLQRILAGLSGKLPKLTEILGGNNQTESLLGPIGEAFGKGDTPGVLRLLVENFQKLNQVQLDNLALLVGGRREAGTFFSLLAKAPETLKALNEGFATTGHELEDRFGKVTQTIGYSFEAAKIEFQKFVLAVLDSGLADGVIHIADGFGILFSILSQIVDIFSQVNDTLQGVPGQFAGITFAVLALAKGLTVLLAATEAITATKIGGALLGAGTSGAFAEGGALAGVTGGGLLAGGLSAAQYGLLGIGADAATTLGIGGTISTAGATALGGATVALPVALTAVAIEQYFAKRQDAGKAADKAQARALDLLKQGQTAEQIKAATPDPGVAFKVADFFGLTGGIDEPVDRALKQFNQPKKTQDLTVLANLANTSEEDKKKLTELAGKLAKNPTNETLNLIADSILANAQNDPTSSAALKSQQIVQDLDAKAADALAHLNDPQNTKTIQELQRVLDKGDSGPAAVDTLLRAQISFHQQVIDGLKRGGAAADDQNLVALETANDKLKKQLDTNVKNAILEPVKFAQKLRSALGLGGTQSDLDQTIKEAIDTAQALDATGNLDVATEQNLLFSALKAITDRRKAKADAASSGGEKAAILNTTPEIPVELQRLEVDIQLRQGPAADTVQEFATRTGQSVEAARKNIVDQYIKFGDDIGAVQANLAKQEKDFADAAIHAAQELDKHGGLGLGVQGSSLLQTLSKVTGVPQADLKRFAEDLGLTIDTAGKLIKKLFDDAGGDIDIVKKEMLNMRLRVAQKALADAIEFFTSYKDIFFLGNLAKSTLERAFKQYQDIMGQIASENSKSSNGLLGGLGNLGSVIPPAKTIAPDVTGGTKDTAQSIALAQLDVLAAQANGDAIKLAQIAQQRAAIDAKFAVTTTEKLKAQAEMIAADNALAAAELAYSDSLRKVANAQAGQDPVIVTRNALASAANALNAAIPGTKAYNDALASYIDAQHAYARSLEDSKDAQSNLEIAKLTAAGDPVGAAKKKLEELLARKADAAAEGITGDALTNLNAQIVAQTAAVAQTQISQGEKQIQTALTLGRINKSQAIAQLNALKVFATSQDEIDQIDLQIKQLQNQLGQDFKFNLPSVLGLPTLYEARRVGEQPGGAGGAAGYQDNRVITVNVNAQTNANPHQIAAAVANVMGPPRSYGTDGGKY